MGLPIAPILIGAGIGALGGAITGNNPFKTALMGAALGTGAGALGAGTAGATAGTAATTGTAGVTSLLPTTIAPTLATTEGALAASSPLMGYTASGISPFLGAAEAAAIPTASSIGAGFGADTIANMATNPSLYDQLSKYATIDNLKGASTIANQFQPRPMSSAPQGRITQGQAPQGGIGAGGVEGLLAELMKRQQQQYQPISLL
jgi:hypothetical protein